MRPYVQTCGCRGRVISAQRDEIRYAQRARESRMSLASMIEEANQLHVTLTFEKSRKRPNHLRVQEMLGELDEIERDVKELAQDIRRHDRRVVSAQRILAKVLDPTTCHICAGKGTVIGNGSALVGGSGHVRFVIPR